MKRFLSWLKHTFSSQKPRTRRSLRQPGSHLRNTIRDGQIAASKSKSDVDRGHPEFVDADPGKMNSATNRGSEKTGPGKSAKVRSKLVREDTGTHDTLKIIDESLLDADDDDESGIDPYNTGQFDRSKTWDSRFRK